jgi:hypothetical protein
MAMFRVEKINNIVSPANINLRSTPPEPGGHFATCQQPGSPSCPQQLRLLNTLIDRLRDKR